MASGRITKTWPVSTWVITHLFNNILLDKELAKVRLLEKLKYIVIHTSA